MASAADIDECEINPCQNGAQCEDKVNRAKCHCAVGYRGKLCDKAIQPAKTELKGTTGVPKETFLAALADAGVSGDVEITSTTYSMEASCTLPAPLPAADTEAGVAARDQFRAGGKVLL